MIKNENVVHTSCKVIIFILFLSIFSIDIYIELLASKGAITPKIFLLIDTSIIDPINNTYANAY